MPTANATITVSVVNNAVQVSPATVNITINKGDTKYIKVWIDDAAHQEGYVFYGIKISQTQSDVAPGTNYPSSIDSNGQYYPQNYTPGTCFIISNADNLRTLWLEDKDRKTHQDSQIDWYYCVGLQKGNEDPIWDDPKVHNLGDGLRTISRVANSGNA